MTGLLNPKSSERFIFCDITIPTPIDPFIGHGIVRWAALLEPQSRFGKNYSEFEWFLPKTRVCSPTRLAQITFFVADL